MWRYVVYLLQRAHPTLVPLNDPTPDALIACLEGRTNAPRRAVKWLQIRRRASVKFYCNLTTEYQQIAFFTSSELRIGKDFRCLAKRTLASLIQPKYCHGCHQIARCRAFKCVRSSVFDAG